jgi:hypothetical protein
MAKSKLSESTKFLRKSRKSRKGIHSKKKNSHLKSSKNYKKRYVGQGR